MLFFTCPANIFNYVILLIFLSFVQPPQSNIRDSIYSFLTGLDKSLGVSWCCGNHRCFTFILVLWVLFCVFTVLCNASLVISPVHNTKKPPKTWMRACPLVFDYFSLWDNFPGLLPIGEMSISSQLSRLGKFSCHQLLYSTVFKPCYSPW